MRACRHGDSDRPDREHREHERQRRVVRGDVALKDAPPAVHPGMTSDITITTASATNVLTVPAAALRGTAGSYSVLVMGPMATERGPVQVGLVTNTTAEVKSGLTAGRPS